jgi:hypothetical protein
MTVPLILGQLVGPAKRALRHDLKPESPLVWCRDSSEAHVGGKAQLTALNHAQKGVSLPKLFHH